MPVIPLPCLVGLSFQNERGGPRDKADESGFMIYHPIVIGLPTWAPKRRSSDQTIYSTKFLFLEAHRPLPQHSADLNCQSEDTTQDPA